MIELAFIACLAAAPDICQNRSLVYANVTPMACMMGAQPELAKWAASHPKYRIRSWRCSVVSFSEREA